MKATLYELASEYQEILERSYNSDGEIDKSYLEKLSSLEGDIKEKSLNIASIVKTIESDIEAMKLAEESIEERRKKLEKKSNYLKSYILNNLNNAGLDKVSNAYHELKISKNPPSIRVVDESLIPSFFFVEKVSKQLNKNLLKEKIKEDFLIAGVELIQETRLTIN